ncbi:MAG: SDR family oxidoreductase [Acidobacteria bacterium]|nr:SDR family oxidoreductase [Acidobacteriota bacterium]MCB9396351.1 SDR family oxidoreductase [Acidobacteriota bacterium]
MSILSDPGKIAIIGASGAIGKPLFEALSQWTEIVGTSRRGSTTLAPLDLASEDWDLHFLKGVRLALILAANSKIADCEQNPEQAWQINHRQTLKLAMQLHHRGIQIVFASTDNVFDGKKGPYSEQDSPNPQVVYGATKLAAERDIWNVTQNSAIILRLSKIYDCNPHGSGLLGEIWQQLKRGQIVRAAVDQVFNPLHIDDLIIQIKRLIQDPKPGTWHLCGNERIVRFDLAEQIARRLDQQDCVQAIHLHDLPGVKRPLDTSMTNAKWLHHFPASFQSLDISIDQLVARAGVA